MRPLDKGSVKCTGHSSHRSLAFSVLTHGNTREDKSARLKPGVFGTGGTHAFRLCRKRRHPLDCARPPESSTVQNHGEVRDLAGQNVQRLVIIPG